MVGAEKLARQAGGIGTVATGVAAATQAAAGDVQGATTTLAQAGTQAAFAKAGGAIGTLIEPGLGTGVGLAIGSLIGGSELTRNFVESQVDTAFGKVGGGLERAGGELESARSDILKQHDRLLRGCGIDGCNF
jgi:hypothetical protein